MNQIFASTGGRPRKNEDLLLLQAEADKAVKSPYSGLGALIVSGCVVSGSGPYNISSGTVYIDNEIMEFDATTTSSFPYYIFQNTVALTNSLPYKDGISKPTRRLVKATGSTTIPGSGEYIVMGLAGGRKYQDTQLQYVQVIGTQTVNGNKTFTGNETFSGSNSYTGSNSFTGAFNTTVSGNQNITGNVTVSSNLTAGPTSVTSLTVQKVGNNSLITFPASSNDPAFINHNETGNFAVMTFSVSDDTGDQDYFTFGSTPSGNYVEGARINSNGRSTFNNILTVNADAVISGISIIGLNNGLSTEITNRTNADTVLQNNINAINQVPSGVIVMWAGSVVSLPGGWRLCDGSGGSPDLRGRFIVGYNSADFDYGLIGNTGGSKTVTLSEAQMPSHTHSINDPGHTHALTRLNKPGGDGNGGRWGVDSNGGTSTASNTTGITINNAGSSLPHENRPPYYTLAYIQKI
jgi:microcystin-dependent protein